MRKLLYHRFCIFFSFLVFLYQLFCVTSSASLLIHPGLEHRCSEHKSHPLSHGTDLGPHPAATPSCSSLQRPKLCYRPSSAMVPSWHYLKVATALCLAKAYLRLDLKSLKCHCSWGTFSPPPLLLCCGPRSHLSAVLCTCVVIL